MKCVVLLFMIFNDQVLSRVLYEYRLNCAESIQEWNIRKSNYICPDQGTDYHCMQLPNGKFVEFCLAKIWIQPDYCPVFNASTGRINVLLCRTYQRPCPKVYFFSNELYKEPGCLISSKQQTTTTSTTSMQVSSSFYTVSVKRSTSSANASTVGYREKNGDTLYTETGVPWPTYAIACGIVIPVVVLCILIAVFTWKHRKGRKQRNASDIHKAEIQEERSVLLSNTGSESYAKETKEDSTGEEFFKPYVYNQAKDKLTRQRVVILVGHCGSGKKTLSEELVKDGYDRVLRKCKENGELPPERDERGDCQVILWHHFLGFWPLTDITEKIIDSMKRWINWAEECKNHSIIFTFNSSIWTEIEHILCENIKDISQYKVKLDHSWNAQLDVAKLYLSKEERNAIMTSTLKLSNNVGFPLLLSLYVLGFSTLKDAFAWFEKPEECVNSDLQHIHQHNFKDYVTLMYCLLNGGFIDKKKVKKSFLKEIKRMCQATTTASKSNIKPCDEHFEKSLINKTETKKSCIPISTTDDDNKEMPIKEEHIRNKMKSSGNAMLSGTLSDKINTADNLQDVSGIQCSKNELLVSEITLKAAAFAEENDQTELSLHSNAQEVYTNASTESENKLILIPDRKKADSFEGRNISLEFNAEEDNSTARSNGKRDNDQAGNEVDINRMDSKEDTNKEDNESPTENFNSTGADSSKTVDAIKENNGKSSKKKLKSKTLDILDRATIEIPKLLEKYLTNEKENVYKFRHEFLMHCLVRYHVDQFGKNIFRGENIDKDLKSYVEQLN